MHMGGYNLYNILVILSILCVVCRNSILTTKTANNWATIDDYDIICYVTKGWQMCVSPTTS